MHPASKIVIPFRLTVLGLMLSFSSDVWSQETKLISADVQRLRESRLEALTTAYQCVTNRFRSARYEGEINREVREKCYAALLENAKTPEERIETCEDEIKEAEEQLQLSQARKMASRGTLTEVLMDKAYLLQSQIRLEQVRGAEPDSPRVEDLRVKWREVLGEAYVEMKKQYIARRIDYAKVHEVAAAYFGMLYENVKTPEDQIKVIQQELNEAEKFLNIAKAKKPGVHEATAEELRYQLYVSVV